MDREHCYDINLTHKADLYLYAFVDIKNNLVVIDNRINTFIKEIMHYLTTIRQSIAKQ